MSLADQNTNTLYDSATIHNVRLDKYFTTLPNSLMQDPNLSWKAKGVACYILSLPSDWKIKLNHLADFYKGDKSGNGRDSMRSTLQELRDQGYLVYKKYKNAKGQWQHRYDLYPMKHSEFQKMFPEAENPTMENPPIYKETRYKETKQQQQEAPPPQKPKVDKPKEQKPKKPEPPPKAAAADIEENLIKDEELENLQSLMKIKHIFISKKDILKLIETYGKDEFIDGLTLLNERNAGHKRKVNNHYAWLKKCLEEKYLE